MPRKKKEEKKHDPMAPWLSQWFITYNTNRTEPDFIDVLEEAWNQILEDLRPYLYKYSSPTIEITEIKEEHSIERGGKYHRIHLHSVLSVDSRGLSMLDYGKLNDHLDLLIKEIYEDNFKYLKDYREYKRGILWVRLVKGANTNRNIEKYLAKARLLPLPIKPITKQMIIE